MTQGTRVTGNLLHDNSIDLYVEVNHGPFLVDHNIFLSTHFLRDYSEGGAYVHNLSAGNMVVDSQERETPFHRAHATEVAGLASIHGGDSRFFNNVFLRGSNLAHYQRFGDSVARDGNVFLDAGARLVEEADDTYLEVEQGALSSPGKPLVSW